MNRTKKLLKGALALVLTVATIATGPLSSTVEAKKAGTTGTIMAETSSYGSTAVIPFRSYYVPYITQNASEKSEMIQYIWCKLMTEEMNYSSRYNYYTASYGSKWSNKYYGDYVSQYGQIKSSRGVQVTYNPDFDGFLYQTITKNPEFIINLINVDTDKGNVFHEYAVNASKHKYLADALIDLTTDKKFLGGGKDASDNVFLKGSSSVGYKYGATPAWSASSTTKDTHDIDVLRLFGVRYSRLNDKQKAWVRTYMKWMVDDYVRNGSSAVAAKNNSPELYDLIATSHDGFISSKAQEFFDECIKRNDLNIGDLIYNGANARGMDNTDWMPTGEADIRALTDLSAVFASDADCDYGSGYGKAIGRGSGAGDGDYDWLAWNIAFSKEGERPFYSHLRELVEANPVTAKQLSDWLIRYNVKAPASTSGGIAQWVANAGRSQSVGANDDSWRGCGKQNPTPVIAGDGSIDHYHDESFYCPGHGTTSSWSTNKPMGVRSISISATVGNGGTGWTTAGYRIYDTSDNYVIAEATEAPLNTVIEIPTKYVASSTVVIEGKTYYRDGYRELVGVGNCHATHYGNTTVNYTYADLTNCQKNNHDHRPYTYVFYDKDGNVIPDSDHTTVPVTCTATGRCVCGDVATVTDTVVKISEDNNQIIYTAKFAHVEDIEQKSHNVLKNSGGAGSKTFSASNGASYLEQGSGMRNLTKEETLVITEDGGGNSLKRVISTDGRVALKSGAIALGAKSVTVNVSANPQGQISIYLKNPVKTIDYVDLANYSNKTHSYTFDLNSCSDLDMEDIYVEVVMYAKDVGPDTGTLPGDVVSLKAKVALDSITVRY